MDSGLIAFLIVVVLVLFFLVRKHLERRKNEPIKQALLADGLTAPVMEHPPGWWYQLSLHCAAMAKPCVECSIQTHAELVALRGEYLVRFRCGKCKKIGLIDVLKINGA